MKVIKHFNLPSSPPPTRDSGKERIQGKWTCSLEQILSALSGNQQFSSQVSRQLHPLANTSRIHQQCWGRNSQASAGGTRADRNTRSSWLFPSQQRLETNKHYTASSIFSLWSPNKWSSTTQYKADQTNHVSCACFRETVLHKSAFHLCLLQQNVLSHLPQQNTNTTDFPKNP